MNDQEALYQTILAQPDDDAPRLIFADWLDEHDQAERAEFIRLQVEQARWEWWTRRYQDLDQQAHVLLNKNFKRWIWRQPHHQSQGFRRGFCDAIAMPASVFANTGDAIFQAVPLEELWVTNEDAPEIMRCRPTQRLRALRFDSLLYRATIWQGGYWPNLTSLRSTGFGSFASFMAQEPCPNLRRVHLDGFYWDSDFQDFVFNTPFEQLEWLKLSPAPDARFRDLMRVEGAWHLLDNAPLQHLQGLCIVEHAIGDGGLLHLARVGRFHRLRELNLTRNEIGATGTTALETFLEGDHFPKLKALTLDDNPLGFAGARELAAWPGLRTLERLQIRGCEIPKQGLDVLHHSAHVHENLLIFSDQGRKEFR